MDARQVTVGEDPVVLSAARRSEGDGSYLVRNVDETEWVYLGGESVDIEGGFPIKPEEAVSFHLKLGDSAYLIASAPDVLVTILEGRRG